MRRFVLALAVLAIAGVCAPGAQAAKVTNLRITTAPLWEQWIEEGTVEQGAYGPVQRACSRTEPRISYTLVRTFEPPTDPAFPTLGYAGISFPLDLRGRAQGATQQHVKEFGPVSDPIHFAFYGQSGRDEDATAFNQLGRRLIALWVDVRRSTDPLVNLRTVRYRGVLKPAGACAQAGLATYNVIAVP